LVFPEQRIELPPAVELPAVDGIYVFYLKSGQLGDRRIDAVLGENGGCLYAGKAKAGGIRGRVRTHLGTGCTGRSSLRRSLGAALKHLLELRAIPRPSSKGSASRREITNYAFAEPGDSALTDWMIKSLELAYLVASDARAAELSWVPRLTPAFDLEGLWPNPVADYVENQLRGACRLEAERAANV